MEIKWKQISDNEEKIIKGWLSQEDKQNLCMTQKGWQQTAEDIEDCLNIMENAQFKNIIGYINNEPVVACMFGVEQIKVLNLYNIVVNPKFRNNGIAKNVLMQLLNNNSSLKLTQKYNKVVASVLPSNKNMHKLFNNLNFKNMGFDGEYFVFEKDVLKILEKN